MVQVSIHQDPDECAKFWQELWPQECLFDLWPVRNCFAKGFRRQPYFLVAQKQNNPVGLLALSWVEETKSYAQFPGEMWNGKTWLEQNRIPAISIEIQQELIRSVPGHAHIRYLKRESLPLLTDNQIKVDEVGYLFFPGNYGFHFQNYMKLFSGKSRKNLARELDVLENRGVVYRHDHLPDIHQLFRMNLETFGSSSYFYDPPFLDSFKQMITWLHDNHMLRITTIIIGGHIAAVDIGALWNKTYTLLAGATNPEFPGVAKMINFHHLQWSCQMRLKEVDFLCGNFGWKERFHLSPRPLFELSVIPKRTVESHNRQDFAVNC